MTVLIFDDMMMMDGGDGMMNPDITLPYYILRFDSMVTIRHHANIGFRKVTGLCRDGSS